MRICNISSKQQEILLKIIAKRIIDLKDKKQEFVLRDYMNSLYKYLNEKVIDKDMMIGYTAFSPTLLYQLVTQKEYESVIGPAAAEIFDLKKTFASSPSKVFEYFGIGLSTGEIINQQLKDNDIIKQQEALEEARLKELTSLSLVYRFSARPDTLNSTTLGNDPDVTTPGNAFVVSVLNDYIARYGDYGIDEIANKYSLVLVNSKDYLRPQDTVDDSLRTGPVLMVSDPNGNILYFNHEKLLGEGVLEQVSENEGSPIVFRQRRDANKIQTPEEIAKSAGITTVEAKAAIQSQLDEINKKVYYVLNNKGAKILHRIKWGSTGTLLANSNNRKPLKNSKLDPDVVRVVPIIGADKKKPVIHLQSSHFDEVIPIRGNYIDNPTMPELNIDPALKAALLQVLVGNNITIENAKVDADNPSAISFRSRFIKTYLGNNYNISLNEETGELYITKTEDGKKRAYKITKFNPSTKQFEFVGAAYNNDSLLRDISTFIIGGKEAYQSVNILVDTETNKPIGYNKSSTGVLNLREITNREYKVALINNTNTTIQYNDETGEYERMHPYFKFNVDAEEVSKFSDQDVSAVLDVEAPSIEIIYGEDIDDEEIEDIQFPDIDSFDKLFDQKISKATPEQIKAAYDWWKSHPMSSKIPFKAIFEIINPNNKNSIATFNKYGITLYKGSDYSDLYHEAFHAFTQIFLTEDVRNKLYKSVTKLSGTTTDYKGNTVKFADMDKKQAEEYLAEKFREYMLSGGKKFSEGTPTKAKSVFKLLLDILKDIFGFSSIEVEDSLDNYQATAFINEAFFNLSVGNIADTVADLTDASEFNKLKAVSKEQEERVERLSYSDLKLLVDTMNSMMSTIINNKDNNSTDLRYSSIINDANKRVDLYNEVLVRLINKAKGIKEQIDAIEDKNDPSRKKLIKIYNILGIGINNYSPSIEKDKKVTLKDVLNASSAESTGLVAYHAAKSKEFIIVDDTYNIEDSASKGKDYVKNSGNDLSAKELAAADIHFLVNSVQKTTTNTLGEPELEDSIFVWNLLTRLGKGIKNADEYYDKLQNFLSVTDTRTRNYNVIKQIVNKLGNPKITMTDGSFQDYIPQQNLWTSVVNIFTLPRIKLVQLNLSTETVDGKKQIRVLPGISKSETDPIKRAYDNTFAKKRSKYIVRHKGQGLGIRESQSGYYLNLLKIATDFPVINDAATKIKFLKAIGIDITASDAMLKNIASRPRTLGAFATMMHNKIKNILELNDAAKSVNAPLIYITKPSQLVELNVNGTDHIRNQSTLYRTLLETELETSGKYTTGMVSNANGDPQYEISLKSTISEKIAMFNNAKSYTELIAIPEMSYMDVRRNPFIKSLRIMTETFGENFWKPGKGLRQSKSLTVSGLERSNQIELLNSAGVAVIENDINQFGVSSYQADDTTQILQNLFTYMIYGVSEATRHSDKSTTLYYRTPIKGQYVSFNSFFEDKAIRNTKIVKTMVGYLYAEVSRMVRLKNDDASANAIVGDSTYKEIASKIVNFEGILTENTRNSIQEWVDTYKISNNNVDNIEEDFRLQWMSKNYTDVYKDIVNYFEQQIADAISDITSTGVLDKKNPSANQIWDNIKREVNISNVDDPNFDDNIIAAYVVNSWMHAYESTVMFYGDPALYNHLKDDFHKRNPFIAATGTIPRTDASFIDFVSFYKREDRYASSKYFKGKLTDRAKSKTWGRTMDTAVLEDTDYKSVNYDDYVAIAIEKEKARYAKLNIEFTAEDEAAIHKEFGEYAEMKIGDGQGWITFDSYRDLMLSMRKWSPSQEKLYWDIIRGKEVSALKVVQFFPVLKMQYSGELATTEGLPLQGFHKFSLMPLIPNAIENSNLEILHNKMVEQGIDYSLFQSGSKINTITKDGTADKFYLDNKNLGSVAFADPDYEFTINPIFTNFFKQQVETSDVYKGKVVFSTQLRKIIEEGLYEEGRPRSFNGTKQQFEALPDSEKRKYKEYVMLTQYESLVNALTKKKYQELQRDAGLTFENGKFILSEKLIEYLNKQLTIQDVAEHEIDFIKYDARANRLQFDLSIHPSAAMLDKLLSALIYKKIVNQKVNGEALIQVSGAGFEPAGLRKATAEENKLYDNGSLPFYKYTKNGTQKMKVKIAIQGDFKKLLIHPDVLKRAEDKGISSLDALNELIKEDKWMKENGKMVTIGGVRIPVSGINMIEAAEVYEFLPENAGNMIVLPAEIVAKSGSDFDIDKLSLMFPNLKVIGKKVKLLTYDPTAESRVDSNKQLLKDLYQNLDTLFAKVEALDTDKKQDDLYKVILEYKAKKEEIKDQIWGDFATVNADGLESLHEELHEIKWVLTNLYAKSKKLSNDVNKIFSEEINPTFDKIDSVIEDIASASSKAIENDLMFTIIDVALMEENFVDFIAANGTSTLKPMSEDLSKYSKYDKYKNGNGETFYNKKGKKRITATKIFELGFNRYKLSSNNIGMRSLGIAAVTNTYNTILNRVGAYMERNVILGAKKGKPDSGYSITQTFRGGLDFNETLAGQISLSGLYDATGKHRIAKLIGQVINGTVDVAKDSWIFDIQGNQEIVPIMLFMFQAGVPPQQVVNFLSQPVIKEYVERQRTIKSAFAKPLGVNAAGTNMFRIQARRDILSNNSALNNYLKEKDIDPELFKAEQFSNRFLKKTIYDKLVISFLNGSENFTNEELGKQLENPTDLEQLQVFLHFIEIEEMSKSLTEIQQGLNFDTKKLPSMFEIRSKLDNIKNLNRDKRLNESIVDDIINNSPIGSFIKFIDFDAVFESLFPIRTDAKIYEALKTNFPSLPDDIQQEYGGKFKDYSALANRFIDDFTNYIYQQYTLALLKSFDPLKVFKGLDVNGSPTSLPVERSLFLSRGGVFVKDGVLHADLKTLKRDFDDRAYSNVTITNGVPGTAPVSSDYFNDSVDNLVNFHKYVKFVYNRETLRSMIPFATYIESEDHKSRYELSTVPDEDVNKPFMIYEEFLRDMAMIQSGNADFMFKDLNGFAKQVEFISAKHPQLTEIFTVLTSLYAKKMAGVINLRLEELVLDSDTINIYHEQISKLANPNIKKVANNVDNAIISNIFQRFPLFAFLQNGLDGKGQMSLGRIVPTSIIAQMQDRSLDWYHTKIQTSEALESKFMSRYVGMFNGMYKITVEDENGDVIEVDTSIRPIMKRYGSFYAFDEGSQAFITPTTYRSDLKVYNVRNMQKAGFIDAVKREIEQAKKAGKTKVFVVNNTRPSDEATKSVSYGFFAPSVLQDMVESGQIEAKHVFSITAKKDNRYIMSDSDLLSDKTYSENTNRIEKELQELASLAEDPNVEIVFDASGVGLPLLGYGKTEADLPGNMISPFTGKVTKTGSSQPVVTQTTVSTGFRGYKGGFEDKGKGTPQGDGKDKAMRQIADSFVVEVSSANPSSSLTSLKTGSIIEQKGTKEHTAARSTKNLADPGEVVMLARNGSLKGKPLLQETKDMIKFYHDDFNMEFVVGDMPGVDSQFIDYLQEIGAKFTIYHTGSTPRISVTQQPTATVSDKKTEVTSIFSAPAPRTYVYLSKRLYELFGYVNPRLVNIGAALKEAKELRAEIVGNEKVTNAEVQEVIKNCLINTLG